jgi:hypothetical protein
MTNYTTAFLYPSFICFMKNKPDFLDSAHKNTLYISQFYRGKLSSNHLEVERSASPSQRNYAHWGENVLRMGM